MMELKLVLAILMIWGTGQPAPQTDMRFAWAIDGPSCQKALHDMEAEFATLHGKDTQMRGVCMTTEELDKRIPEISEEMIRQDMLRQSTEAQEKP